MNACYASFRFLPGNEAAAAELRAVFAEFYPLSQGLLRECPTLCASPFTETYDRVMEMVRRQPENYVLKPQREGGGLRVRRSHAVIC